MIQLILFVLYFGNWRPPLTAQGVTRAVRRLDPTHSHNDITAGLHKLAADGRITTVRNPHLPARFQLSDKGRRQTAAEAWFNSATWQARKKKLL